MPHSGRGAFGASWPPSPETTAYTTEAVWLLAQAVTWLVTEKRAHNLEERQGLWVDADDKVVVPLDQALQR